MHLVDEIISMGKVAIPLEQGQVLKNLYVVDSAPHYRNPFGAGENIQ